MELFQNVPISYKMIFYKLSFAYFVPPKLTKLLKKIYRPPMNLGNYPDLGHFIFKFLEGGIITITMITYKKAYVEVSHTLIFIAKGRCCCRLILLFRKESGHSSAIRGNPVEARNWWKGGRFGQQCGIPKFVCGQLCQNVFVVKLI